MRKPSVLPTVPRSRRLMPEAWWLVAGGANHRTAMMTPMYPTSVPAGTLEGHDSFQRPYRDATLGKTIVVVSRTGGSRSPSLAPPPATSLGASGTKTVSGVTQPTP